MAQNNLAIAFASGKGGTGKTSLAVNFAKYLSGLNQNTCLYDLDVEEPNTDIYFRECEKKESDTVSELNIPEIDTGKCTYCGQCAEKCNFNAIAVFGERISVFNDLCKGCGRCGSICPAGAVTYRKSKVGKISEYSHGRLNVIEGLLDTGNIHTKHLITDVKKTGKNSIRIFDCPPGTTCPMVETVHDADYVILVTEPTPFGLHDLSLAVEVARKLERRFGIVINKSDSNDAIIEDFCSRENIRLLGRIPFSVSAAEKCGRGEFYYNDDPYSAELNKIHEQVMEVLND